MSLYQPRIKDHLIRKLYLAAKREGKKMTHLINDIVEAYFVDEPEPPPDAEKMLIITEVNPHTLQRKMRRVAQRGREDHRETVGAHDPSDRARDLLALPH